MVFSGIRRLSIVALATLAACSQGVNPAIPPAAGPGAVAPARTGATFPVKIHIKIRKRRGTSPRFVSPGTKSAKIVVTPANQPALPAVIINCTSSLCSGTVTAPIGYDAFGVYLYDQPGGVGQELGGVSVAQAIVIGQNNVVNVVVNGIAASVALHLTPPKYNYLAPGSISVGVVAYDEDGYTIAGNYYYPIDIGSSDTSGNSSLSGTSIASSTGTVTLTYNASFNGTTVSAQGVGVTKITQDVGVNLVDDWVMFAHDAQRTGFETMPTGINTITASQLTKAWVTSPDNGACATIANAAVNFTDEAAPVVWGGFVFYANTCGAVYALNRATGATVWSKELTSGTDVSGVYGTPMIDTSLGVPMLLVPVWGYGGTNCPGASCVPAHGGFLAALNAQTGQIIWETTPLTAGQIRGEPLAINGTVYVGISGGDSDTGYVNGGMMAINETTGTQTGFFQVAPGPPGTGDGGGSWSPISYDGTSIYFGTGNTQHNDGDWDSVVKLNPATMSAAASDVFKTWNGNTDEDVGGGQLIWKNNIYFTGKSGNYYGFPLSAFAAGTPLFSVLINTYSTPAGNGGIGTPTTDGNVISTVSGYNSFAPTSSDLDLFPVGSGTKTCTVKSNSSTTSTTANSVLFSSIAWVNGVGFMGMDNGVYPGTKPEFRGFDENCNIKWSANEADVLGFFYAGPAVAQSGVYAVDNVGNVYAWKLPATMGVDARGMHVRAVHLNPPVKLYIRFRKKYFPKPDAVRWR
jgi:outer membrane protein assembly factor BamB